MEQPIKFYRQGQGDGSDSDSDSGLGLGLGRGQGLNERSNPVAAPSREERVTEASIAASMPATGTCTDAETFALQVQDDSMEPEFRNRCIIIIDPTGRACHGAYVLADLTTLLTPESLEAAATSNDTMTAATERPSIGMVFRQLLDTGKGWQLRALNGSYDSFDIGDRLDLISGVIVQRAGTRRSYHKHYE